MIHVLFFYSSKLRKSKKKEYSDWLKKLDRKHSKFYIYNEESYKHLLDKATMDKIILTICKRYERDLYYSFEWEVGKTMGNAVKKIYNDTVAFDIATCWYVSNEEY